MSSKVINNFELTNSNHLSSVNSSCEIKVICLDNNLRPSSPSRFKVDKVSSADFYQSNGSTINSSNLINGNSNCNNHVIRRDSIDNNNSIYETKTLSSHLTREAAPRVDHYRNMASVHGHISRPTLDELHGYDDETPAGSQPTNFNHDNYQQRAVKLGWITGVLVRCLSGIWGIMLFLRMGWVVAHAGIGLGSVIVMLSSLVSTVTSLSMSAICTNGEVKGGGTYYMISRSLGPEFGGSIGVIFSLANAVAAAMYTIGFAEAINSILKVYNSQINVSDLDNMRIIGCITLFILIIIIFIGTGWESKVQVGLVIILIVSIFNFVFGSLRSPSSYAIERGFVGWKASNLVDNFGPEFRNGETFFSIFSVYFPAATGFLAGANISGDLKDPQKAIPLGTLTAIAITTASYILFITIFGGTSVREVIAINGTSLLIDGEKQGLYHNYNLILLISFYGPLIYCGIFAAAISSALGSLVSAPKVFQALCRDKVFPYLSFFGHGSGPNDSPYRGYILGFAIALACCLVADLNAIAPIISNFFLAAYCLINFSCFHASFSKTLGFRPSFRFYNMWVSLVGSIVCLVIMFIMNWPTALITFIIEFILFILVLFRKPDVNWGSSTRAQIYKSALSSAHKLYCMPDHTKTYRPQILLLSGDTFVRPSLVDFAYQIVQGVGLMVCGNITQAKLHQKSRESLLKRNNDWLRTRGIKAFYSVIDEESFGSGAKSLIQASGIGKLRPNIVFMGYKNDWQTNEIESIQDYFNVIHQTLDKHLSLCILRVSKGFDYSRYGRLSRVFEVLEEKQSNAYTNKSFNLTDGITKTWNKLRNGNSYSPSDSPTNQQTPSIVIHPIDIEHLTNQESNNNNPIPDEIIQNIDLFRKKSVKSTIDVWWLYDDGGLTMLIPYILSSKKQWSNCRLRVFTLAEKRDDLNSEQLNMASLLSKFRIDYSDVIVIPDISKPPKEENKNKFKALIGKWRVEDDYHQETILPSPASSSSPSPIPDAPSPSPQPPPCSSPYITDTEWNSQKRKSYRQIRIRELVEKYSTNSSLIVMTLPIPRKGSCSASLFMAWLETLTVNMPPFLLVRGSQQSVLTFYS